MPYCTNCGGHIEGDHRFCSHCGAPAPEGLPRAGSDAPALVLQDRQRPERATRWRAPLLIGVGVAATVVVAVLLLVAAMRPAEELSPCVEKVEAWTLRIDGFDAKLPDAEAALDPTTYRIVKDAVTQEVLNDYASADDGGLSAGTRDLIKEQCQLYG
jgi:predicted nucleic acid-binding Zn ribbon protein